VVTSVIAAGRFGPRGVMGLRPAGRRVGGRPGRRSLTYAFSGSVVLSSSGLR